MLSLHLLVSSINCLMPQNLLKQLLCVILAYLEEPAAAIVFQGRDLVGCLTKKHEKAARDRAEARYLFDSEHLEELWPRQGGEQSAAQAAAQGCADRFDFQCLGNTFSLQSFAFPVVSSRCAAGHFAGEDDDVGRKDRLPSAVALRLGGPRAKPQACDSNSMGSFQRIVLQPHLSIGAFSGDCCGEVLSFTALQECHFRVPGLRVHGMPSVDVIGDFAREAIRLFQVQFGFLLRSAHVALRWPTSMASTHMTRFARRSPQRCRALQL